MNYIIVDFEFNQSYDFKNNKKGENEKLCPFEIIQIGAVKLDENFNEVKNGRFNELIKPVVYPKIHPHVNKITGFTTETFSDCEGFPKVIDSFLDFCGEDDVFVVWGDNDMVSLFRNLNYYGLIDMKFSKKFINIQKYASRELKKINGAQIGLKNAIIALDIPYDGDFHDAFNDAFYTAEILKKLSNKNIEIAKFQIKSILPKPPQEHKKIDFANLYKVVEKDLGKKLNEKDKSAIRKIYKLGRDKEFG